MSVAAAAVLVAAVTPVVVAIVAAPPAAAATGINGGGSGFAALEIDQWRADTARRPFNLSVNYVAQGSSVGRANFATGLFDFGASDIIYSPNEVGLVNSTKRCGRPLASCFRYVPVSAGGLGMMYNLVNSSGQRIKNLQLTRADVCNIFTGQVRQWSQLAANNPDLASFGNRQINVVIRSDGAGESYVLSEFCIAVAPDIWNRYKTWLLTNDPNDVTDAGLAQGKPVSNWPGSLIQYQPKSASGSDGVANTVADPSAGVDTITYDAAGYAKVRDFPVASVQNAAGVYQQPDETNVTVALGYASPRADPPGTFILNFTGPDPRAYFPSTYSYVLAQTTGWDPGRGATLGQFLCYAVGEGQVVAPALRYARLSSAIVQISVNAISAIPGAPPPSACTAGAPPPPPPPVVLGLGSGGTAAARAATAAAAATTTSTAAANAAAAAAAATAAGTTAGTDATASDQQALGNLATGDTSPTSLASKNGPTTDQALGAILEGALICALVVGLTGWRKRAAA